MYGWRAKIGLIKPTLRGKAFALWYTHAPAGVEILPTYVGYRRGDRATFETGLSRIDELADELVAAGVDAICVSGGPPFLLQGDDFENTWQARLEKRLGLPVIGPLRPHADALRHLGVKRVVVASYYKDDLNDRLSHYLAGHGLEAIVKPISRNVGDELYSVSLKEVESVSWQEVYRHCRSAFAQAKNPDGIYIHGAGWDAEGAIRPLEDDVGVPVVFGPVAEMWTTYRRIRVKCRAEGIGRLMEA